MPPRILIADDHPDTLRALQAILEHNSRFEVCFAAMNGSEALIKSQELRPDLIILDLTMPVMNGIDAAREISKILPATPILLHTLAQVSQAQAASVGIREVISKAKTHLLLNAIENALIKDAAPSVINHDPGLPPPIPGLETNVPPPQPFDDPSTPKTENRELTPENC